MLYNNFKADYELIIGERKTPPLNALSADYCNMFV